MPEGDVPEGDTPDAAETPDPASPTPAATPPPAPTPTGSWPAQAGAAPPFESGVAPAPTDTWNAPPPKPRRKLTWLWVLLGVLGLVAVVVVVGVVLFVRTLAGPIDATNKVLAQIKAQDYPAAYRLACAKDRDEFTVDQYAQAFKDTVAQRGRVKSYDVNYSSVHGSTAEVRYDIEFDGGRTLRLESSVHKEHGKWRPCLLQD